MIEKKEVRYVAKLARLNMSQKEEEKFTKELSSILQYVEKLKEVDTSRVEPTSHPFDVRDVMREDIVCPQKTEIVQRLLEAAPAREKTYIKVKAVFKRSE